jgi:hypothetical protein
MVDERSLEALRQASGATSRARLTLAEFKMLVREQFFMLLLDRRRACRHSETAARQMDERRAAFAAIREVLSASAEDIRRGAKRLKQVAGLFGLRPEGEGVIVARSGLGVKP